MVQRQSNKDQMRARSAIRVLPGFKRNRPRPANPEAAASAKRIHSMESAVSSARYKTDRLISEYCNLKFSRLAAGTSRAAEEARLLKREYCLIATAILRRARSAVDQRDFEARSRQIDLIDQIEDLDRQRLAEIERLQAEVFAPKLSARRHVDANLETLHSMQAKHDYLYGLVRAVTENSILLQRALRLLVDASSRATGWKRHLPVFIEIHREFSRLAHIYRSIINIRRLSQSQFADAWPFKFYLSPAEERGYNLGLSAKRLKLSKEGKRPRHNPSESSRFDGDVDRLKGFYFPHSESQRDHLWHLHRRQLDTMAPFLSVDRGAAAIVRQVHSLSLALGKDLWRNLSDEDIQRYRSWYSEFKFHYADRRAQYKVASILVWHMNWMRLKAEDRLHTLCGLDVDLGKEFVISKPISQNLMRFQQWAYQLRVDEERVMAPLPGKASANSNPRDSLEPEDVEDEDGRGRCDPELVNRPLLSNLGSGQAEQPPVNKPRMQSEEDSQLSRRDGTTPTSTMKRRLAANSQARSERRPKAKRDSEPYIQKAQARSIKQFESRSRYIQKGLPLPKRHTETRGPYSQKAHALPKEQPEHRRTTLHPSTSKGRLWPRWPGFTGSRPYDHAP